MKKKSIKFILIAIILISAFFIFKNWQSRKVVKIDTKPFVETSDLIISGSLEKKILTIKDDYSKFEVTYPFFKNADQDFNLSIENLVKSKIEEHKIISKENWQARFDTQIEGDNISKIPKNNEEKFSFISDFTIVQSNNNYISFILRYGGFNGGAHGYEDIVSFNYDVKNQKNIEIKDIFSADFNYLNYISLQSRDFLKKEYAVVSDEDKQNSDPQAIKEYVDNIVGMIKDGTEPKEENFSVFTFTNEKIKIYFAQYQVGPYVIGMPEVEIDRK